MRSEVFELLMQRLLTHCKRSKLAIGGFEDSVGDHKASRQRE